MQSGARRNALHHPNHLQNISVSLHLTFQSSGGSYFIIRCVWVQKKEFVQTRFSVETWGTGEMGLD